jgi:hypothetical protein
LPFNKTADGAQIKLWIAVPWVVRSVEIGLLWRHGQRNVQQRLNHPYAASGTELRGAHDALLLELVSRLDGHPSAADLLPQELIA